MDFDGEGNLYVVSYWNSTIRKYDPAGAGTVFATVPSNSTPRFITFVPEPAAPCLLALLGGAAIVRRTRRGRH
jgi:hypothetical protein